MDIVQGILFFIVSFSACTAGAICGIGGGVIIKPVLDLFGWESASTISFLSGCTVLAMSCYSIGKSLISRERSIQLGTATPLAIGAALGGIGGKQLFLLLTAQVASIGRVQAVCLLIVTVGTLLYTDKKEQITTLRIQNGGVSALIGGILGIMSSFLGIGGGPINIVVLRHFFSMDSKTAAANSLYIIFFSQLASLLLTLAARSVPAFEPMTLALMLLGGIGGGIAGRAINKRIENRTLDRLFIVLMGVIILICVYNSLAPSAS